MARKTGRPSKFTKARKDRIIQAIKAGCTYELASDYAGITRKTLWEWLKKGEDPKNRAYVTFSNEIKKAEAEGAMVHLGNIEKAAQKDWKASAWMMERRHSYSRDGIKSQRPQEKEEALTGSPLEILREQAKELRGSMKKAQDSQSWQAYAALQRQFISIITQIRQIEAEEGMGDEFDGLTDEQLLAEITGAIVSLPPILRQRLESTITDLQNVVSIEGKK